MAEGEVARDHLQHQLIHRVEQVGAPAGGGVGDVGAWFDPLHASHPGGHHGVGRLEARIGLAHLQVLAEHGQEAAVMGGRPVPGRPLSLLNDAFQRPVGARQVGDGPKVRPAEGGLAGLVKRRADEQPVLAQPAGQMRQPPLHRTVQMTLRRPILAPRHHLPGPHRRQRRPGMLEPLRVGVLGPLRPLQVHKMLQRRLAERQQPKLHPGRIAPRLVRQVRPAHIRRRPHGRKQILHHRPMQHLLTRDGQDHPAPALDGRKLIAAKTRTRRVFEAERGIQVLAHQAVLKLSTLAEEVGQLLAVLHHDGRLSRHSRKLSLPMAALNGENTAQAPAGGQSENDCVAWQAPPVTRARLAVMRGHGDTDPTR